MSTPVDPDVEALSASSHSPDEGLYSFRWRSIVFFTALALSLIILLASFNSIRTMAADGFTSLILAPLLTTILFFGVGRYLGGLLRQPIQPSWPLVNIELLVWLGFLASGESTWLAFAVLFASFGQPHLILCLFGSILAQIIVCVMLYEALVWGMDEAVVATLHKHPLASSLKLVISA